MKKRCKDCEKKNKIFEEERNKKMNEPEMFLSEEIKQRIKEGLIESEVMIINSNNDNITILAYNYGLFNYDYGEFNGFFYEYYSCWYYIENVYQSWDEIQKESLFLGNKDEWLK